MKIKNIKQTLFYICAVGFSICLLFFIVGCSWIGYDIKQQCHDAKSEYHQDCVQSLINLLDDENKSFKSRNSAIWALGQLGDKRALLILQKYYTANIPSREPLEKTISQYELNKAIKLVNGDFNLSKLIWKIGFSE